MSIVNTHQATTVICVEDVVDELPPGRTAMRAVLVDNSGAGIGITPSTMKLTGYTSEDAGDVSATDTLLQAIAKLEARIAVLEA